MESLLTYIASFLISPMLPIATGDWVFQPEWRETAGVWEFTATSAKIITSCQETPSAFVALPLIVQGVQTISVDGKLVYRTGDPTFQNSAQSFNTGSFTCALLQNGEKFEWTVRTITHSLAKLTEFPTISATRPASEFFFKTLNDAAAVAIPLLGLISAFMFYGKIESRIVHNFLISALLYGLYFAMSNPSSFQMNGLPFSVFRLADGVLWIATIFQMQFFGSLKVISTRTLAIHNALVVLGMICIGFSSNLDESQVGSTIGMGSNLFILSCILANALAKIINKQFSRTTVLQAFSLASFVFAGTNDILLVNGFIESNQIFHIGILGCMCFMALATNERILIMYRERDYLRANLQVEVERKTVDLRQKSEQLEATLTDLKHAQADLVHSAKLASLGTLSAGIAHEINNSLNYVKGSIQPLETLLNKDSLDEQDKGKIKRLLGLMKEGLSLTLDIISNLKRHMGSTGSTAEVVNVLDSVKGTLLLLTSKLGRDVAVQLDIADALVVSASRVSISQVLMNLVSNAVDAMEKQTGEKKITIKAGERENRVWISVGDSGSGIPENLRDRIFDPFFTTKDVGKGTGLGLHIVRQEVQKCGGTIQLATEQGKGATFVLNFPTMSPGKVAA